MAHAKRPLHLLRGALGLLGGDGAIGNDPAEPAAADRRS